MAARDRKNPSITILHRVVVGSRDITNLVQHLKATGQGLTIRGKKLAKRYSRFIFSGVPAKHIDFVIGDDVISEIQSPFKSLLEFSVYRPDKLSPEFDLFLVEIGTKSGRYDGAVRDRITIKGIGAGHAKDYPVEKLRVIQIYNTFLTHNEHSIALEVSLAGDGIRKEYPILEMGGPIDLRRILWWQYHHWYKFLKKEEVESEVEQFIAMAKTETADWDANDANRAASRFLYKIADSCGWRKLSKATRTRIGFPSDCGEWQRAEYCTEMYRKFYGESGDWINHDSLEAPITDWERIEMEFGK